MPDVSKLSTDDTSCAFVRASQELASFSEQEIVPKLETILQKSDQDEAIIATYGRMKLLLRGIGELSDPCHFQIAIGATRTMFELLLDTKFLVNEKSAAAKFFAFPDVSKFHKAAQLERFLDQNPTIDRAPHQRALTFAQDPARKKRIEQLCIQHWGASNSGQPKWPEHWTGKNTPERAAEVGLMYVELYRSQFFLQSYHIHSGAAGILHLSRAALTAWFGMAHALSQNLFSSAIVTMCEHFHFLLAYPNLKQQIELAANSAGYFVTQQSLDNLEAKDPEVPTSG